MSSLPRRSQESPSPQGRQRRDGPGLTDEVSTDVDVVPLLCRPPTVVGPRSLSSHDLPGGEDDHDIHKVVRLPAPFPRRIWPAPACHPQTVGAYRLLEEIGHGGMAAVHLGYTTGDGPRRVVAIKQASAGLTWRAGAMPILLDEGRLLASIRHPNVVPLLDMVIDPTKGEMYLVMEYVHGATLAHLLGWQRKQHLPPPPRIAAGIIVGILDGLHAAHDATTHDGRPLGIVHCDVSPQNIMVGADGVARIIDFGVAHSALNDGSPADASADPALDDRPRGKRRYMSPEQIRSRPLDRRTDVYSAGVVLWELLAGRRLFRGENLSAVWGRILRGQRIPPSAYAPEVLPEVDAAVLRALDREPECRFATARDFAAHLREVMDVAEPVEVRAWVQTVCGESLERQAVRTAQLLSRSRWSGAGALWRRILPSLRLLKRQTLALDKVPAWRIGAALLMLVLGLLLRWSGNGVGRAAENSARPPASRQSSAVAPLPTALVAPPHIVQAMADAVAPPPASAMPVPLPAIPSPLPPERPASTVAAEGDDSSTKATPPVGPTAGEPHPAVRQVSRMTIALRAVEDLNRKAARSYRQHDFSGARKLLYKALAMCATSRLDLHRQAALAHAQLGAVLVRGFHQRELAAERFRTALRIDRRVPVDALLDNPEVRAAFRLATGSP